MTTRITKRILYHHRTQAKGAEGAHIRGMVDGFRSLGCKVDVIGPPGVDPYVFSCSAKGPSNGMIKNLLGSFADFAPQPCFEAVELGYNLLARKALSQRLTTGEYDLVYERYALNSFIGSRLANVFDVPLVLEVNDATIIERSRPLFFTKMARRIEKAVFQRASLVITISNSFKELIVSNYEYPQEKILVLPNAIDTKRFDMGRRDRLNKRDLGVPDDRIVIGCAGAFVPWHGLEFLVEAIADLVQSHKLFLLFIGDGPVREQVEKIARANSIEGQVLFTGFLSSDQVPQYLDLLDICVIPDSNSHCSPMKLFEYMVMAKPIVLPRYQPLLDVLSEGSEGLFFDPHDTKGLRDAIMLLVHSAALRNELGAGARVLSLEKHTWEKHCSKVLEVFS